MANVTIYTTQWCPFCIRAKMLLNQKGAAITEIAVDRQPDLRQQMIEKSGRRTVPQIWIDELHVGGCDELFALEHKGKLDEYLRR